MDRHPEAKAAFDAFAAQVRTPLDDIEGDPKDPAGIDVKEDGDPTESDRIRVNPSGSNQIKPDDA